MRDAAETSMITATRMRGRRRADGHISGALHDIDSGCGQCGRPGASIPESLATAAAAHSPLKSVRALEERRTPLAPLGARTNAAWRMSRGSQCPAPAVALR